MPQGSNLNLLYSHIPYHNDITKKEDERRILQQNIYPSHYCKGSKRLFKVCVWEGAGNWTETAIFWPSLLWPPRCVFLVLLMFNRRSRGPLCWVMASFTASYQQLLWSPNSIRVPESPLGRVWFYLPHLVYLHLQLYCNCNLNSTVLTSALAELYNSSTPTRSPTRSLKSHV